MIQTNYVFLTDEDETGFVVWACLSPGLGQRVSWFSLIITYLYIFTVNIILRMVCYQLYLTSVLSECIWLLVLLLIFFVKIICRQQSLENWFLFLVKNCFSIIITVCFNTVSIKDNLLTWYWLMLFFADQLLDYYFIKYYFNTEQLF